MEDSRVELEDHLGGNDIIIEERIGQSDESFKNPIRSCHKSASTGQNQSEYKWT